MMRSTTLLTLCAAFALPQEKTVPTEVTGWLRDHSIATSHDPQHIAALATRIGKARVICFGDAAAGGAREPAILQHELLQHSVAILGLQVLAIDANAIECRALDDYLVTGQGEINTILASLRDPRWKTREVLDTIAWLRVWNSKPNHAHKVHLVGLDVQYTQLAAQELGDYMQKVEPEAAPRISSILSPLRQADKDGRPRFANATPELRYVTMAYLPELASMLEDNREAHIQASSEAEWKRAKKDVAFLIQAEEVMRAAIDGTDPSVHERVLADNVAAALDEAGAGGWIVVWTDLARAAGGMGQKLHERFGAECVRIGLNFDRATDVARRGQLSESEVASLQSLSTGTAPVHAWIDLRDLPENGAIFDWFRELRAKLDTVVWFETVSAAPR